MECLYISFQLIFVLTVCFAKLISCVSPSTMEIIVMILKAITSRVLITVLPFSAKEITIICAIICL
jgi:hypothetical protein